MLNIQTWQIISTLGMHQSLSISRLPEHQWIFNYLDYWLKALGVDFPLKATEHVAL